MEAPATPTPTDTFSRFIGFLHKLIDYGERLTTALQRASHLVGPRDRFLAFGTTDLRVILARIKRGLLRAQALEAELQRDPTLLKDNLLDYPAPPLASSGSHPPGPRPAPRHTRAEREDAENQALLARLPTVAELAEQIRQRTPGDVLVEICRDLGIMTDHPLFVELASFVIRHGGSTVPLTSLYVYRLRNRPGPEPDPEPPTIPPPPTELATVATGPP